MSLRVALFYHSLVSDWNHGNAHFLRGVASELQARGHAVTIYEPGGGWSRANLQTEIGTTAERDFEQAFPALRSITYRPEAPDLEAKLAHVDLALIHEWNDPALVAAVGAIRRRNMNLRVFFHDTHHRAITAPLEMARFDLSAYDGVLAYGASLSRAYQKLGWGQQVYTWHEAADTRTFYPRESDAPRHDIVWIGNWGDEERTAELHEFLLQPVSRLALSGVVYGVRYPAEAITAVKASGLAYRGWIANHRVPHAFAQAHLTVHVPRRPYLKALPGIPTIRPFEALACGIPLISAPWSDEEGLFRTGVDYLAAGSGKQMRNKLAVVLQDSALRASLRAHGLETIHARHTCSIRVDELFRIYAAHAPASMGDLAMMSGAVR